MVEKAFLGTPLQHTLQESTAPALGVPAALISEMELNRAGRERARIRHWSRKKRARAAAFRCLINAKITLILLPVRIWWQRYHLYPAHSHFWQKFPDIRQGKNSAERSAETLMAAEWVKEKL